MTPKRGTANPHAKQRDVNESPIVEALRKAGYEWEQLDIPCDGIASRRGLNHLIEIKNPDRRWYLTRRQKHFRMRWKGCIHTVESPIEAIEELAACEAKR
jgi:hypothetical protein